MSVVSPDLLRSMRAAQAAWLDARDAGDRAALPALARAAARLEGEVRLARLGIARKAIPAGRQTCSRCGGYGGSEQWPGWVCYACDGVGHEATR